MKELGILAFAFFAAGCAEHAPGPGPADFGGTMVISTTSDPGTLFPPHVYTTQGKQITEQIYDYLADVGPDFNSRSDKGFRPGLSDGWRWSGDSLMLTFHINPRAKWHDGKDVTARDVQFTFALNKNPALGGRSSGELANIDSVTVPDSFAPRTSSRRFRWILCAKSRRGRPGLGASGCGNGTKARRWKSSRTLTIFAGGRD